MGRRRNRGRTWRCNLSISEEAAERLKAYTATVDRRPTAAAAELLLARLAAATEDAEDELADLRRRNRSSRGRWRPSGRASWRRGTAWRRHLTTTRQRRGGSGRSSIY
jgi:hypothetical protein